MKRLILLLCLVAVSLACFLPSVPGGSLVAVTLTPTQTSIPAATSLVAVPAQRVISCARVTATSLHVRYAADYYSGIMGWFVQDTILTVRWESGDWWVVHGYGIDFQGRKTRMTGFVKSEFLELCPCYVQSQLDTQRR